MISPRSGHVLPHFPPRTGLNTQSAIWESSRVKQDLRRLCTDALSRPSGTVTASLIGTKFPASANPRTALNPLDQSERGALTGTESSSATFDALLSLWTGVNKQQQQQYIPPASLTFPIPPYSGDLNRGNYFLTSKRIPFSPFSLEADLQEIISGGENAISTPTLLLQTRCWSCSLPGRRRSLKAPRCLRYWVRWRGQSPGWCDPRWLRTTPAVASHWKVKGITFTRRKPRMFREDVYFRAKVTFIEPFHFLSTSWISKTNFLQLWLYTFRRITF